MLVCCCFDRCQSLYGQLDKLYVHHGIHGSKNEPCSYTWQPCPTRQADVHVGNECCIVLTVESQLPYILFCVTTLCFAPMSLLCTYCDEKHCTILRYYRCLTAA